MNSSKQPKWLRGLEIAIGLVGLALGIVVIAFPGLGAEKLVILLSVALLFASARLISVIGFKHLSTGLRAMSSAAGIISLALALFVILFPSYSLPTLIAIVSLGLIIYGVNRIFAAYTSKRMTKWLRGVILAVGLIDVILSVTVLAIPSLASLTATVILSFVLLISGVEMLVSGAIGHTWLSELMKGRDY